MMARLSGTFTAVYTPFRADGGVDEEAFRAQCARLVSSGSGLVPCGTTGETPTLSETEWELLVRVAVEVASGQVPVIPGTGSNDTADTVRMTRRAAALGADAALVVAPPYNKPPQRSLLAHFRAVADGGGLPILIYNVPGRCAVNLAPETTLALAEDRRFIGVKEAAGQLAQFEALVEAAPSHFSVLSGDDAWTLPLLVLGGHGVVSVAANVAPALVSRLVSAGLAGDLGTARGLHFALRPLVEALFAVSNPIPVKFVAALLGHARADVRLPLTADALEAPLADRLARIASTLGLAR